MNLKPSSNHILVPMYLPDNEAVVFFSAFKNQVVETLEDAKKVWLEQVCITGLSTSEGREYFQEYQKEGLNR